MGEKRHDAEARRNPRFDVQNLDGRLAFNLGAEVVNISPAGMCVRTTSALVVHRSYQISLHTGEQRIQLQGTIRWCTLRSTRRTDTNEVEPLYETGIAFDGVLTEAAAPFLDFLRQNVILNLSDGKEGMAERLFGRFELNNPKAELSNSDRFEVRRLSLSGMLARSPAHLPRHTFCDLAFEVDGTEFSTRARIVHSSQIEVQSEGDDDTAIFDMGVEFIFTTPEALEVLESYIKERFGA